MKYLIKLFILIFLPLIIFSQTNATNVYYYLYESTDKDGNPFAIIVEICSDQPTSPGEEFTQVTIEELHNKGYRTPSESEADAQVKDEHELTDGGYSSWIYCGYRGWDKYVECGFKTSRSWWPGFLGIETRTIRQKVSPSPGPQEPLDYHFWETWGYYTKRTYTCRYLSEITYDWWQYGRHWFNSRRNPIYESSAYVRW